MYTLVSRGNVFTCTSVRAAILKNLKFISTITVFKLTDKSWLTPPLRRRGPGRSAGRTVPFSPTQSGAGDRRNVSILGSVQRSHQRALIRGPYGKFVRGIITPQCFNKGYQIIHFWKQEFNRYMMVCSLSKK